MEARHGAVFHDGIAAYRTMEHFLIQGLKIATKSKFLRISHGPSVSIREDVASSTMDIVVPEGFHGGDVVSRYVEAVEDMVLEPTDGYVMVKVPEIDLNGLVLKKIAPGVLNFNQFLVKDLADFVAWYDDRRVVVLVPESRISDKRTYVETVCSVPMFELVSDDALQSPANIYGLKMGDESFSFDSDNGFVFATKQFYERYSLRMIDVMHSFITKLGKRLEDFGLQLVGFQMDEESLSPNNVKYRITELGRQVSRPSFSVSERYAVKHKSVIEFELSASSLVVCNDFKTRYQNYDLISDFTEFYTMDSHGVNWISNVVWGEISTNYTQDFETDQVGAIASTAQFSCELNYYVVFDDTYPRIRKIITDIVDGGTTVGRTITR